MRYLLIDHITELVEGKNIKGIKNVAMTEDFLEFHFPGYPVMPGVMVLEAMVQLTGWLEAASSDFKNWFSLTRVKRCSYYGFALPGDQLELSIEKVDGESPFYRAEANVKGKRRVRAEYEGEVIPLEEIDDPAEKRRFFGVLRREIGL
ncbi:MAG: beta-hydroxyacyl-ACP dehydratase [Nitrospirae bacterium]|nr:MAG: beta-hydroxyacyl-ACP dehydratase [Nitrospirota bacterium]